MDGLLWTDVAAAAMASDVLSDLTTSYGIWETVDFDIPDTVLLLYDLNAANTDGFAGTVGNGDFATQIDDAMG